MTRADTASVRVTARGLKLQERVRDSQAEMLGRGMDSGAGAQKGEGRFERCCQRELSSSLERILEDQL